jgi:hypothetical protein
MSTVEALLKEYRDEVNIAVSSFFVWKNLNNIASANREMLRAINANALSWCMIAHSLQVTFFVAFGRIFDRDNRSLTLNTFLRFCRDNVGEFSKRALEARRLRDAGASRPEWLDDFLKGAYEPIEADILALQSAAAPHKAIYRANYEPIRHKIIAHKDLATIGASDSLFQKTNIAQVQGVLEFLHQVVGVVTEWLSNGRKTALTDHRLDEETYVREHLEKLLSKLAVQGALHERLATS